MPVHSALFVALSCLLLSALAGLTTRVRIRSRIFVGYGDRTDLQRLSRAHGVSVEHLLPMLLLLVTLELCGADHRWIDAFGVAILASRLAHVVGFIGGIFPLRITGMTATYAIETALGISLLLRALRLL